MSLINKEPENFDPNWVRRRREVELSLPAGVRPSEDVLDLAVDEERKIAKIGITKIETVGFTQS